jgi:hypothetical protein
MKKLQDETVIKKETNETENIDTILKNITSTELYKEINSELSKQYNTIKLEGNDIKNYEFLKEERNKRNKKLYDIDEENNSSVSKSLVIMSSNVLFLSGFFISSFSLVSSILGNIFSYSLLMFFSVSLVSFLITVSS